MKKIFAFLAIATMFAVACSKPADNKKPNDEQKPDNQEQEYAGPTEGTSDWSLIGALLGSSWDKDFVLAASGDNFVIKNVKLVAADEFKIRKYKETNPWSINRGGAFAELGKGFAVENNGDNIKPGLDGFYDIWYNPGKEQMAVCAKDAAPVWGEGGGAQIASIEIDGKFDDWASLLSANVLAKTFGDPESDYPALDRAYVYADASYIYVYFEWVIDEISAEKDVEHVPFHCYINTDGDEKTGGFGDQWSDACSDVCLEGSLYDVLDDEGTFGITSYDPGIYSWTGEANGSGWKWSDPAIVSGGSGVGEGAGIEGKYEFKIDRSMLADAGFPVADEFSIGFDIQQHWDSVGILPREAGSEANATGILPSLKVVTAK